MGTRDPVHYRGITSLKELYERKKEISDKTNFANCAEQCQQVISDYVSEAENRAKGDISKKTARVMIIVVIPIIYPLHPETTIEDLPEEISGLQMARFDPAEISTITGGRPT